MTVEIPQTRSMPRPRRVLSSVRNAVTSIRQTPYNNAVRCLHSTECIFDRSAPSSASRCPRTLFTRRSWSSCIPHEWTLQIMLTASFRSFRSFGLFGSFGYRAFHRTNGEDIRATDCMPRKHTGNRLSRHWMSTWPRSLLASVPSCAL